MELSNQIEPNKIDGTDKIPNKLASLEFRWVAIFCWKRHTIYIVPTKNPSTDSSLPIQNGIFILSKPGR